MAESPVDLHSSGGTPFSKMFSCCFPKHHSAKSRSVDFAGVNQKNKPTLEYEDPDKSESGMVYFDLPDVDDEETTSDSNRQIQAPPFVQEFWKLLFSLLMFDWLRQQNQPKQIKNE